MIKMKQREGGKKLLIIMLIFAIAYGMFREVGVALVALYMLLTAS